MRTNIRRRGKRKMVYFGIILAGIVLFMVFGTTTTANAGTQTSIRYKYYKSIEIQDGSSLWDIAQTYMTEEYDSAEEYIKEVKKINHMRDDLLYGGSYICVPYYSSEYK